MDILFTHKGNNFLWLKDLILFDENIPLKDEIVDGSFLYGQYFKKGIEFYKVISSEKKRQIWFIEVEKI